MKPWRADTFFCLVCGLLVGISTWFADTSAPFESADSRASEDSYNLLVQGFSAGQLNLKQDAPPELAKLSDPYDLNLNAPYIGTVNDLTYYKGKLYLYFGVTPALAFFWPYYAVTGHFLSEKAAVAFFMGIGFAAIAGILRGLRRRYFPETGKWIPVAGTIMPGLALALTLPANVHETAITCGFAFAMLALAAIWAALHDSNRRLLWLALASLAYGLAIGARPTLFFGAAILLLPVLQAWGSVSRLQPAKVAGLFLAAAIPITCVGLGLMLYNFERFNNPFEFGWHYQLNSSYRAPSAHQFGLHYLWFNMRLYFLEPFNLSGQFPFLKSAPLPPTPPGYDLGNAAADGGILMIYPVVLFALAVPMVWKRKLLGTALGWFAAACLILFIAGAVTVSLFFASANTYELDFLPGLLLLALIGTYCAVQATAQSPGRRRLICAGWFVLMTYSIVFNFLANIEARAQSDYFVGNSALSQGRFDEAQAHYHAALALFPKCADAFSGLGDLNLKQGRLDEAIIEYQQALKIDPDLVEAHNNLGHCLLHTGRLDDAITQFETAAQMRPRSVNYRNALGAAYAKKGMWNEAIAQFEKSIEIEPGMADAHNDLGYCLLQTGRADDAIAEHQKAVRLEPGSPSFLVALANALCQKGLFDEAAVEYKKALQLRPDDAEALNNLGYCLRQIGHTDEAIAEFQKAIKIQPNMAGAYFSLGNAYREKKMAAQAIASYQKVMELAPQFVPAQSNLAWMLATWPDSAIRNGDKAITLAKHLNDLAQGHDPKTLRTLAAAYAETGNFAEASSAAKQALALAQTQSDKSLTTALQTDIRDYQAHIPLRSAAN
ncbi:MAG TPA: tetratricopeptide repeat protein [Verrucomicrobiae bacterium]|nr:tetratricopeptide repeat protein [Verrucomicrobiae bacterium]